MTHYTVLVIGEDVEGQLAPYDENLSVPPYREYLDADDVVTAIHDALTDGQTSTRALLPPVQPGHRSPSTHSDPDDTPEPGAVTTATEPDERAGASAPDARRFVLEALTAYYERETGYEDGPGYYYLSTYNPNGKWDWWCIGGRWPGFFWLKPGEQAASVKLSWDWLPEHNNGEPPPDMTGRADQARKGQIDFDRMRAEAAQQAGKAFDAYEQAVAGTDPLPRWDDFRDGFASIDAARAAYAKLPRVQALEAAHLMPWPGMGDPADVYGPDRQGFIARRVAGAYATYAVVWQGKWYARGRMGWWGLSDDDLTQQEWYRQYNSLLDGLADDMPLTVIDCHI